MDVAKILRNVIPVCCEQGPGPKERVTPMFRLRSIPTLLLIGACSLPIFSRAQSDPDERLLVSDPRSIISEDMLRSIGGLRTTIADMEDRDLRDAPAHVQVITDRHIKASGARNLMDVLHLVPGVSIGRDMDDVPGVGIHGNWAFEGKCLFMLNGVALNENDFGTYGPGSRITLDNVERIEVVLGPGSVLHGGYAALGVINIVTRSAEQGSGARVVARTGMTAEGITRSGITVSGAHRLDREQDISYLLSHMSGRRSNALNLLPDGSLIDHRDSSDLQASTFQFNYRWRDIKASMHYMDESFHVSDASYRVHMRDVLLGLEQRVVLGDRNDLLWKFGHADQLPWYYVDSDDLGYLASNTTNRRSMGSAILRSQLLSWLTSRVGVQGFIQRSAYQLRNDNALFAMNGSRSIIITDGALIGELNAMGRLGNLTVGYRVERNSLAGEMHAPRLAITRSFGRFHGKILYSEAFRMPTVMNINYGPEDGAVVPERITTTQAEMGLTLGARGALVVNAHRTIIVDPIVYVYEAATIDNYLNRNRAGSEGFDLRINLEDGQWLFMAGVGAHRAILDADIPEAMLPTGTGTGYQGLPAARATATIAWEARPWLGLRLNGHWNDRRWSYQYSGADEDTLELIEWPTELVLNTGVRLVPDHAGRFNIDLACSNLFNERRILLSPFNNALTPFRMNGREFTLAVTFKFVQ